MVLCLRTTREGRQRGEVRRGPSVRDKSMSECQPKGFCFSTVVFNFCSIINFIFLCNEREVVLNKKWFEKPEAH